MMKRSIAALLLLTLAVLLPQAAWGITYGQPDNGHPYVGSFVAQITDPDTGATEQIQLCTGTLVSPSYVVSASHCFVGLPDFVHSVSFTLDPVIDADQDGIVDPSVTLLSGTAHPNPLFASGGQNNPYDVAVFQLDHPVTGVQPAQLPTPGVLDSHAARHNDFVAVGYGTVRETNRTAFQAFKTGWRRMMATQHINSVTGSWVTFSGNVSTGNGGTCYGDSGGPHLLGNVVVAVTVTGDRYCKATDKDYRLDTPAAQDFLGQFGLVP